MFELLEKIVLSLHVLGAAVIIGGIFASLFILVKEKVVKENLEYLKVLWKALTLAIGVQILTGIYLAAGEWHEFRENPLFWVKIGLFVVDGLFGGKVLGDRIKTTDTKDKNIKIKGRKRLIWISLLIFVIIATLGVFLAEAN